MEQDLRLGRYRLLARVGDGGHGSVDLAFDTKMSRRVAIKRIPLSRTGVQRLSRTSGLEEARTAALLNHPNVVTIHEWDTDEDEAFLVMEFVDGVSLAELLEAYAPFDLDEAAAILAPVLAAVGYAHDNGVLHLDLKPENVLVTRDGLVKVADFGVASLTNAAGQAICAGGTLGYMPPEQLRGAPVDARTDVWALASVAYEILTGSLPFDARDFGQALERAEGLAPPMPGEVVAGIPPAIDVLLADALSPAPDRRPPSASELSREMLPVLGDPESGRTGLRQLVEALIEEKPEQRSRASAWERFMYREPLLRRGAAALAAGWLAGAGVAAFGLGWPAAIGAALLAGAAGAAAPPYGLAAGTLALIAGAFAVGVPYGLFVGLLGVLWWALLGRTGEWDALAPLGAPLFGAIGVSPALPLLAGFLVRGVARAFLAGASAGVLLAVASLASGRGPADLSVAAGYLADPLGSLASTGISLTGTQALVILVMVVTWGAAAAVCSLLARQGTRFSALLGAVAGMALLLAGSGPWVTGGQQVTSLWAVQFALSSILVAVVVALGAPIGDTTEE